MTTTTNLTPDAIRDRLAAALQPIVDEAAAAGLLVGGALRVLEWDGRWVPRYTLTVRRSDAATPQTVHDPRASAPVPAGVTGDCCVKCGGSRMQQAGACKVCLDCGEAGGCG